MKSKITIIIECKVFDPAEETGLTFIDKITVDNNSTCAQRMSRLAEAFDSILADERSDQKGPADE